MYKNDPQHFQTVAKEWTMKYAMGEKQLEAIGQENNASSIQTTNIHDENNDKVKKIKLVSNNDENKQTM
jgi:hypothetical protein